MGSNAGFFSEYNNMIYVILYCFLNQLQFVMHSKYSNIGDNGWTQYFIPVFNDIEDKYTKQDSRYNTINDNTHKKENNIKYYTSDIFWAARNFCLESIHKKTVFNISEIGFKGTVFDFCKMITHYIWVYNYNTQQYIENKIADLKIQSPYISCHIRRGDKITEWPLVNIETYIQVLKKYKDIRNVYILTDDYTIIEEIKKLLPDYNIFYNTDNTMTGFNEAFHNNAQNSYQTQSIYNLLVDIEIARRSNKCIVAYNSNVGCFLKYFIENPEDCINIYDREWEP